MEAPLENIRRHLANSHTGEERVNEITDYATALAATFQHVVDLENIILHDEFVADPIILDGSNSWPLLIKLYRYHGETLRSAPQLRELLRNIEIVLLKLRFQHGRSSNDLIGLTKQLDDSSGMLEKLCERLKQCVSQGFRWRGDFDQKVQSDLDGDYHYNTTFRYILWKYENSLRQAGDMQVLPMEYINSVENRRMDSTIEHIAPQNGDYPEEFRKRWLNNLGNLLFMPRGLNSSLSDQSPLEKAKRLDTSFASHREVRRVMQVEGIWSDCQIVARKADLIRFIQLMGRVAIPLDRNGGRFVAAFGKSEGRLIFIMEIATTFFENLDTKLALPGFSCSVHDRLPLDFSCAPIATIIISIPESSPGFSYGYLRPHWGLPPKRRL
ncbi:MAG: HNH endonuclease family protein [Chthoniobacter sp.]